MSSSKTAAAPPKRKLTKKQQEEEDERLAKEAADAAAAALAAIPPSPFDRIDEVWALEGKYQEQRALVGEIFHVEDGPGICIQALTLDDINSHLQFARSIGLNTEQLKVFFSIMQSLKAQLSDSSISMEAAFNSFKMQVMANAAIVRKPAPQTAAPAQPASSPVPALAISSPQPASRVTTGGAARPQSSAEQQHLQRPNSRGKGSNSPVVSARSGTTSAAGGKSTSATPRGAAAADDGAASADAQATAAAAASASAASPRTFSLGTIKHLTEYVTQGYFQHYRLYQAAFNPRLFRPRARVVVERLLIETYVADPYPSLEYAVEITQQQQQQRGQTSEAEEAKQKEAAESDEKDAVQSTQAPAAAVASRPATAASDADAALSDGDEIGLLVRQHMQRARAQMMQLLSDNERALDSKLAQLEQKIYGAQTAAAPPATKAAATPAKKR